MPVLFVSESSGSRPFRFERRALLGRDEGNDLRLNHPTVSGHHAVVMVLPDGSAVVKDLRSSNGIRVRGERVRGSRLEDGDLFYLGNLRLKYQADRQEIDPMITVDWELGEDTDPALVTGPLDVVSRPARGDVRSLHGQARDLLAMYALTNAIHSTRTEEGLFRAVGNLVERSISANRGAMVEVDPENGALIPRLSWPEGHDMSGGRSYSRTVVDRVVRDGETIMVPDVALSASLRHAPSMVAGKVRSVLCAPLRCQSRTLGIIFATRDSESRTPDIRGRRSA